MKKHSYLVTAALLALSLSLAGCTGNPGTETTTKEESKTEPKSEEQTEPKTEKPSETERETKEKETESESETKEKETESESKEKTSESESEKESGSEPSSNYLFTKETYPKVDGATAQYPMSLEIAKGTMGLTQEEAEDFIVHHTTKNAYYNLIDKTVDVIFVSEPSDDIIKRATEAGVTFEMAGIGYDGFVFVINDANPVESLTIDQIRDIYTGKITNWKEVGGEDVKICAYQREQNSGSQNLMEKMVMQGTPMMEAPKDYYIDSMSGLIDEIADFENSNSALGYSVYLYAKDLYVKDHVKFLGVNGVIPSDDTIGTGEYPLTKVVYAVYRSDEPEDSPVRKLCDWLRSDEGQKAVEAGGYTKLKGEAPAPVIVKPAE